MERADLIHDLNNPIPTEWAGQYDVVFDVGVVEHVCDIFRGLSNCISLLKVGGTVAHLVPLHGWHNQVFFNFQPQYFAEVYRANGFEPTRTFINFYPSFDEWIDRPMLYREYQYGDEMIFQEPRKLTNTCFFATKVCHVAPSVRPLQGFYLRYHGETPTIAPAVPPTELDGRMVADVKKRLPIWLLKPLLALNRLRLKVEDALLPYALRERLWCWRRRRYLRTLDRARRRMTIRI
ncbi:MAG: hypothetical protein NTY19_00575 [Planctomycetota bacterium]|nr:hypothetical protein [Planctomycetota bacterium]